MELSYYAIVYGHMDIISPASRLNNASHSSRGGSVSGNEHAVSGRTVAPRQVETCLLALPGELLINIANRLSLEDLRAFSVSCKRVNSISCHLICKKWFSRFDQHQQRQLRSILAGMTEKDFRAWAGRFTSDRKAVGRLAEQYQSDHHSAHIYYQLNRLMSGCQDFSIKMEVAISHDSSMKSAALSSDGRVVLTVSMNGVVKIHGRGPNDGWMEKATITHQGWVESASFSPDDNYVVTASFDKTTKIYGRGLDNNWTERVIITHAGGAVSAGFSADSQHLVIASTDGSAKIYGRGADGDWTNLSTITHSGILSAAFCADSSHMMTKDGNIVKIHGRRPDNSWTVAATIFHDSSIKSATFSTDSRHVLTVDKRIAIIYSREPAGTDWLETATIIHKSSSVYGYDKLLSASFSSDSRYVVTASDRLVKIHRWVSGSGWMETARFSDHVGGNITSVTFSADSRQLITTGDDFTARIYRIDLAGNWVNTATIRHLHAIKSASFNISGSHVMLFDDYSDGYVKIYGRELNGSWREKAVIRDLCCIQSAIFSADGSLVMTTTIEGLTQAWSLSGKKVGLKAQCTIM